MNRTGDLEEEVVQGRTIFFKDSNNLDVFVTINILEERRVQLFITSFNKELVSWGVVIGLLISKEPTIDSALTELGVLNGLLVANEEFWGTQPGASRPKLYKNKQEQIITYSCYLLNKILNEG